MPANNTSNNAARPVDDVKHSDPIPITQPRGRARSVSSASSGSASSTYDLPTPISGSMGSIRTSLPSPTSSPIFSYFLNSSPTTKAPGSSTFPLRRKFGGPSPVFEEEEEGERVIPAAAHMRRTSTQIASRFTEPKTQPLPDPHLERGTSLLRRLSLSSAPFVKTHDLSNSMSPPSPPPNTAVSPTMTRAPLVNKPRRSATISVDNSRPRRAPSPMGERILKGHFDGF